MQKTCITLLLLLALSSCATQSGNYAKLTDSQNEQLATDTTRQLVAFYPPASTHFALSQISKDAFGVALQKDLRESGYGIEVSSGVAGWFDFSSQPTLTNKPDFHSDRIQKTDPDATHQAVPVIPVKTDTTTAVENNSPPSVSIKAIPLSYVVDSIGEDYTRVTVKVRTEAISRVYSIAGGSLRAAGAWTRKE